jgi:hypothetical protein
LSWLLPMAICLAGALWRSRRRQKASAEGVGERRVASRASRVIRPRAVSS